MDYISDESPRYFVLFDNGLESSSEQEKAYVLEFHTELENIVRIWQGTEPGRPKADLEDEFLDFVTEIEGEFGLLDVEGGKNWDGFSGEDIPEIKIVLRGFAKWFRRHFGEDSVEVLGEVPIHVDEHGVLHVAEHEALSVFVPENKRTSK